MALTSNTAERLLLDGGTITVDTVDLGALSADAAVSFTLEREYYAPNFVGKRGDVKGTVYIIREVPTLAVELTEWQLTSVQYAIPGASFGSDASSEVISPPTGTGRIAATQYIDEVKWTGTKSDGFDISVSLYNALMRENFEVEFTDEEEARYPVSFVGHMTYNSSISWRIVMNVA